MISIPPTSVTSTTYNPNSPTQTFSVDADHLSGYLVVGNSPVYIRLGVRRAGQSGQPRLLPEFYVPIGILPIEAAESLAPNGNTIKTIEVRAAIANVNPAATIAGVLTTAFEPSVKAPTPVPSDFVGSNGASARSLLIGQLPTTPIAATPTLTTLGSFVALNYPYICIVVQNVANGNVKFVVQLTDTLGGSLFGAPGFEFHVVQNSGIGFNAPAEYLFPVLGRSFTLQATASGANVTADVSIFASSIPTTSWLGQVYIGAGAFSVGASFALSIAAGAVGTINLLPFMGPATLTLDRLTQYASIRGMGFLFDGTFSDTWFSQEFLNGVRFSSSQKVYLPPLINRVQITNQGAQTMSGVVDVVPQIAYTADS